MPKQKSFQVTFFSVLIEFKHFVIIYFLYFSRAQHTCPNQSVCVGHILTCSRCDHKREHTARLKSRDEGSRKWRETNTRGSNFSISMRAKSVWSSGPPVSSTCWSCTGEQLDTTDQPIHSAWTSGTIGRYLFLMVYLTSSCVLTVYKMYYNTHENSGVKASCISAPPTSSTSISNPGGVLFFKLPLHDKGTVAFQPYTVYCGL